MSLTDALLQFGLVHQPSATPGRRQLMTRDAVRVGAPVCAATGWQLVHLLRAGEPATAETVALAIDLATAELVRA